MKLLFLILANDTPAYLEMQRLWQKYMNIDSNIKSYFIKYDVNKLFDSDVTVHNDTIYMKGENDSLIPGCLDKTIKAIEYSLNNFEFDYLIRTNMSSVWDFNKIYSYITDNHYDIAGVNGFDGAHKVHFVSGAGILMSNSLCKELVKNKHLLNYDIIDDVSIGKLLIDLNYKFDKLERFEAYVYEKKIRKITKKLINNSYHFRCKSINQQKTIQIMEHIIKLIYDV